MKKFWAAFTSVLAMMSCGEEITPLTPDLVTEITIYDLGNADNASDLRVDWSVRDNLNVLEYRIFLVPPNSRSAMDVGTAEALAPESYVDIVPESFSDKYSIGSLPADLLDVNGDLIRNGQPYEVAILVYSIGDSQLSLYSNSITLREQSIYAGRYFIGQDVDCRLFNGNVERFADPASGWLYVDLIGEDNAYRGLVTCIPENCPATLRTQGSIEFTVDGISIPEYIWNWPNQPCPSDFIPGLEDICEASDSCPLRYTGSGLIEDDLMIEVTVGGLDCVSDCDIIFTLVRQPD